MVNKRKLTILVIATLVLLGVVVSKSAYESYQDDHQVVAVGVLVKVRFGFYEDCKGPVIKEVYTQPVTDRNGILHPTIFAGYAVDLTCNNEHTGDRFFTPDFLRVVRK